MEEENEPQVVILQENIYSYGKGQQLYGGVGDKVEIINVRGNVLIVRDSKGKTFPVASNRTNYIP